MQLTPDLIKDYAEEPTVIIRTVLRLDHEAEPEVVELFSHEENILLIGISSKTVVMVTNELLSTLSKEVQHWNIYRLDPECMESTITPAVAH